jgi:hypothetical protein
VTTPDRDFDQRMEALAIANRIRVHRARMKVALHDGDRTVIDVLVNYEPEVDTMKVFDLLVAAPKIGKTKANAMLRACGVSPSRTVAGITDRQRGELVAMLRPLCARLGRRAA